MNGTVFRLTLRQLAGSRRTWLLGLLASLIPIGLAAIYRAGEGDDPLDWTANVLLDNLMLTVVAPLVCLLLGTSALGSEIEDGTAVYLLSKPVPRRAIILSKAMAAFVVSAAFLLPATAIAPLLSLEGTQGDGIVAGFFAAAVLGIVAYTVLFVLLSIITSRALFIGLAYVFIWEGAVGDLFTGTRYFSIHQYCLGIADALSDVDTDIFNAALTGIESIVLILLAITGATFLATRALGSFELRETD